MRDSFLLAAQQKQSSLRFATKQSRGAFCAQKRNHTAMVIEWLKIPVPTDRQIDFLRNDQAIWTEILSKQHGFAGKECWRDPDSPEILNLVIRWESLGHWNSVPASVLAQADRAFLAAMGASFPVASCTRYDVVPSV